MKTRHDLSDELRAEIARLEALGPGEATEDMPETDFRHPSAVRGKYAGGDNRVAPWLLKESTGSKVA